MGGFTANIGKYMKINLGKGFSVFYEKFKPERNKITEESLTQSRLWQDSLVGADPYTGRKTYISRWRLVPIYTTGVVFFAVLIAIALFLLVYGSLVTRLISEGIGADNSFNALAPIIMTTAFILIDTQIFLMITRNFFSGGSCL